MTMPGHVRMLPLNARKSTKISAKGMAPTREKKLYSFFFSYFWISFGAKSGNPIMPPKSPTTRTPILPISAPPSTASVLPISLLKK